MPTGHAPSRSHRAPFDAVVKMLAEGFVTSRGRGRAYLTMIASTITSGAPWRQTRGYHHPAFPIRPTYVVIAEPDGMVVDLVDEDFAVEASRGHHAAGQYVLANQRVETGKMRVEDAQGAPPPFRLAWEARPELADLSAEVAALGAESRPARGHHGDRPGAFHTTGWYSTRDADWISVG